jgi:hypothetical protein
VSLQGIPHRGPPIPAAAKLADRVFFKEHEGRKLRIREPIEDEYLAEFRSQFGAHDETRRRVIVAKLPAGVGNRYMVDFMRIPFLLFADETVEDTDEILRPILDRIMREAAGIA